MRVFKAVLNGLREGGKKESSFLESLLDEESKVESGRRSFLPEIRMRTGSQGSQSSSQMPLTRLNQNVSIVDESRTGQRVDDYLAVKPSSS